MRVAVPSFNCWHTMKWILISFLPPPRYHSPCLQFTDRAVPLLMSASQCFLMQLFFFSGHSTAGNMVHILHWKLAWKARVNGSFPTSILNVERPVWVVAWPPVLHTNSRIKRMGCNSSKMCLYGPCTGNRVTDASFLDLLTGNESGC